MVFFILVRYIVVYLHELQRWITQEWSVSELLDWVMTEAETFAKEFTTHGDKMLQTISNNVRCYCLFICLLCVLQCLFVRLYDCVCLQMCVIVTYINRNFIKAWRTTHYNGSIIEMAEELVEHQLCKGIETDDTSSHRYDVIQHWNSLINWLGKCF